jgi:hypothetical protein
VGAVHIDANMVHGWSPSPCACQRVISQWSSLCHHVESGVSRFIPSMRLLPVERLRVANPVHKEG